jgi:hypothetical protein
MALLFCTRGLPEVEDPVEIEPVCFLSAEQHFVRETRNGHSTPCRVVFTSMNFSSPPGSKDRMS